VELGTVLASSWSAGISVYAVIAALGIAGRVGWIETSDVLQQPWLIALALALAVVDLVIDKVAWLDSVWDAAHTVIRPAVGAAIGALAPNQMVGPTIPDPVVLALAGGGLAFSSHVAKASVRAAVNSSPEPFSNVVVSLLEDGLIAALLALAFTYPRVAGVVTLVLFAASVTVSIVSFRVARRTWRRLRWGRPPPGGPPAGPAGDPTA
jgi:hypothetical protein